MAIQPTPPQVHFFADLTPFIQSTSFFFLAHLKKTLRYVHIAYVKLGIRHKRFERKVILCGGNIT